MPNTPVPRTAIGSGIVVKLICVCCINSQLLCRAMLKSTPPSDASAICTSAKRRLTLEITVGFLVPVIPLAQCLFLAESA